MTTLQRMNKERLEWWKEQQRSGKLGHNFECLIRDFQTERAVVERVEACPKNDFRDCVLRSRYKDRWLSDVYVKWSDVQVAINPAQEQSNG